MIDAYFARGERCGAVSSVYQYDTGQRLRILGLPAWGELCTADECTPDESAFMVQVQYSREEDSQALTYLARYDETQGAWIAGIPDEYLTSSVPIHMYIYAFYGETEEGLRGRTVFEGVFTPISRPAPDHTATDEQWEAWASLSGEMELALVSVQTAKQNVQDEADSADAAAVQTGQPTQAAQDARRNADESTEAMQEMERIWLRTLISREDLEPGSAPAIRMSLNEDGSRRIVLGIPGGESGTDGAKGDTGPADITFLLDGTTLYTTTT